MMKLPIGIQDFAKLRSEGYLYVDKTEFIYHLATEAGYYFLSRPRRFGKSLLVSTLKELFEGNQELFKGLWIENHWDWTQKNPVLDFRFNNASYKISGLEAFLKDILRIQSEEHQITLREAPYPSQLEELIKSLSQKYGKVVVLIDEYDKPILDYLNDIPQAVANRDILKNFYSVLKPLDPHLRLVLLTGVSKFSRVSIFSELNNLLDLSLHAKYGAMLGYTQEELEHYFADRIETTSHKFGGRESLLIQLKKWYNGYSWNGQDYVYNPFSILNFFDRESFENFWFETGTPTFLLKLLDRERSYNLDKIKASPVSFNSFELEHISPEALLFQTGYLTIKAIGANQIYTLSYPNYEVKNSLLQYLLAQHSHNYAPRLSPKVVEMMDALEEGSIAGFVEGLNSVFATIPYQIFITDKEAYYHSVTFLTLSLMGTYIQAEVSQSKGRPDAVVFTREAIYVMEFKLDESAEAALEQIKQNGYAQPYLNEGKPVKALGFNFSSEKKEVDVWVKEELSA